MNRRLREDQKGAFITSAGWLFADLLLALAMLFLVANTLAVKPSPIPTPAPTQEPTVTADPTAKPLRVLERTFCRLELSDPDPDRYRQDRQYAINTLEPQINALQFLQGRRVGTAIAYGGVSNIDSGPDRDRGVAVAAMTYSVLDDLASKEAAFKSYSPYKPLFTANYPYTSNSVIIDIYLFVRANNPNDTCTPDNRHP